MNKSKKGEYFSLASNFSVINNLSSVIALLLIVNYCIAVNATITTTETTEIKYTPDHIERSCIEKCPDQVSFSKTFQMLKIGAFLTLSKKKVVCFSILILRWLMFQYVGDDERIFVYLPFEIQFNSINGYTEHIKKMFLLFI